MSARTNPKAPHNQPFNVGARKSSKVKSWFNPASPSYWKGSKRK